MPFMDRDGEMREGRRESQGERGRKKNGRKGKKPSTGEASFGWRWSPLRALDSSAGNRLTSVPALKQE